MRRPTLEYPLTAIHMGSAFAEKTIHSNLFLDRWLTSSQQRGIEPDRDGNSKVLLAKRHVHTVRVLQ